MERRLKSVIEPDLPNKIILISGPRQTGKTTLSRSFNPQAVYLDYDDSDDRFIIQKRAWDPSAPLIVFDELHKMPEWKRW
ncbi:ATP-binding protein, partial [bacterium]|nr:ATP-binding protein [bacterium]